MDIQEPDNKNDAENSIGTAEKRVIGRPFPPGTSGNPGGRPARKLVDLALEEQLEANNYAQAIEIAQALIAKAKSGDVAAIKLVAERTEGKALQKIEHSGTDGSPIQTGITVRFVSPGELDEDEDLTKPDIQGVF